MVVNDFDLPGIPFPPCKTDSPLVIDPDAPLPLAIPAKLLQPVSRRLCKFLDPVDTLDLPEFAERDSFNRCEPTAMETLKEPLGFLIAE